MYEAVGTTETYKNSCVFSLIMSMPSESVATAMKAGEVVWEYRVPRRSDSEQGRDSQAGQAGETGASVDRCRRSSFGLCNSEAIPQSSKLIMNGSHGKSVVLTAKLLAASAAYMAGARLPLTRPFSRCSTLIHRIRDATDSKILSVSSVSSWGSSVALAIVQFTPLCTTYLR